MTKHYWQDKFLQDHDHLRADPGIVRPLPPTQTDIRRNIAQLLGDTIETMDAMIAYSGRIQTKAHEMVEAGIDWDEMTKLNECLSQMDALRSALKTARPLHRLIAGVNTPNTASRVALQHAHEIGDNAVALQGKVLDLHHAVEAVKDRIERDMTTLTGPQKEATLKFAKRLQKAESIAQPDAEAYALTAAACLAASEMQQIASTSQNQR